MSQSVTVMAFAVVIIIFSLLPRREVGSRGVRLLRVCFPSWRFFGDPGLQVQVLWRVHEDAQPPMDWQPAMTSATRRPTSLLWNPRATLRLAEESIVRDALADIDQRDAAAGDSIEEFTSFQLLRALAEAKIDARLSKDQLTARDDGSIQYEFLVRSRSADEDDFGDHLHAPPIRYTPRRLDSRGDP